MSNSVIRKAIILDLLQIGENVGKFSDEVKSTLNQNDIRGVIGIRNCLVHGYVNVDNQIVWNTINIDLPCFIIELK